MICDRRKHLLLGTSLRYSEGNEFVGEAAQNVFIQTVFPKQTSLDIGPIPFEQLMSAGIAYLFRC